MVVSALLWLMIGLEGKKDSKPWMNLIWRSYLPPKHSSILWLAFHTRFSTKDNWFDEENDRRCIFCNSHIETISHLFFNCTFTKSVWRRVKLWLNVHRDMNTLLSAVKWIKKDFGGALIRSKAVILTFASTVYVIWKAKNCYIFAGKHADSSTLVLSIMDLVYTSLFSLYPPDVITF